MSSDHVYKYSLLHQGNKLIWKLPWLILCPIESIGIIYGKCITFIVCFKNITFIYFKNISESERTALTVFCPNTSKKSHAHLRCVHNNCTRFEECQPKGVREVGAVYSKHAGKMTKFNYM
jgi:hypothetical protein